MSLLIKGGRVLDPASGFDAVADVLLRDGRVAEVCANLKGADETFDARGLIVAPGFIDLHVHLREPGQFHKETIASGTAAAAAGGFTSVCCMPNTNPVNDLPAITRWMQAPERGAVVNVFPIAAATQSSAGERLTDFAALRRAGAVAVTDDGKPILDPQLMREALRQAAALGIPVVQHAEDTRATANTSMHDGPTAFRLGLRGISADSEARIVTRDIELARETGGHLHVAHLSTAAALDAVRDAKRRNIRVTCEVTPHHLVLTDEDVGDYDTNCKMNPPLRSAADRRGVRPRAVRDHRAGDGAGAGDHAPLRKRSSSWSPVALDRAASRATSTRPRAAGLHHLTDSHRRIVRDESGAHRGPQRSRRVDAGSDRRRHDFRSEEEVDVRRGPLALQVA